MVVVNEALGPATVTAAALTASQPYVGSDAHSVAAALQKTPLISALEDKASCV